MAAMPVIADALPDEACLGSACWHLAEGFDQSPLSFVGRAVDAPAEIAGADLLKRATRRLVFRHRYASVDLLVKAFPLTGLKKRLQHRKYADAEVVNLLQARKLGLPVPVLYAFGRSSRLGLVNWNALITEFVDLPCLEAQMAAADMDERRQLIDSTYPFFDQLYRAGCNHIDLKPGSFLTDAEGHGCIIDFQYVDFLNEPSPRILASQAGHFAWDVVSCNGWLSEQDLQDWFIGLLGYLGMSATTELMQVFERTAARRYPIAERLRGVAGTHA